MKILFRLYPNFGNPKMIAETLKWSFYFLARWSKERGDNLHFTIFYQNRRKEHLNQELQDHVKKYWHQKNLIKYKWMNYPTILIVGFLHSSNSNYFISTYIAVKISELKKKKKAHWSSLLSDYVIIACWMWLCAMILHLKNLKWIMYAIICIPKKPLS
jgi:hypothetical protein